MLIAVTLALACNWIPFTVNNAVLYIAPTRFAVPDTRVVKSKLNRSLLTSIISLPSKVSVRGYTINFKSSSGSIISSSIIGVRTHKSVLDGIAIKLLNRVHVTPISIEVSKSDCPTVVTEDSAP